MYAKIRLAVRQYLLQCRGQAKLPLEISKKSSFEFVACACLTFGGFFGNCPFHDVSIVAGHNETWFCTAIGFV